MASIPLFLLLSLYALYIAMATRISTPFLAIERPASSFRTRFDTSNYGKLQLDNGLALTPQMGIVVADGIAGISLAAILMKK